MPVQYRVPLPPRHWASGPLDKVWIVSGPSRVVPTVAEIQRLIAQTRHKVQHPDATLSPSGMMVDAVNAYRCVASMMLRIGIEPPPGPDPQMHTDQVMVQVLHALDDAELLCERAVETPLVETRPAVAGTGGRRPDGPFGTDGFRWKNAEVRGLSAKQFAIVVFLWTATDNTATFQELAKPVWGEKNWGNVELTTKAPSVASDTTKFFEDNGIPFRVKASKRNHRVSLICTETNSEKN